MRIKVHSGTPVCSDSNLCHTCRHSTVVRGRSLDEEIVQCQALSMRAVRVTFKVTSCSAYSDGRQPSYLQMVEDAWILQPGSKRRAAGFVRSADMTPEDLSELMVDVHKRVT